MMIFRATGPSRQLALLTAAVTPILVALLLAHQCAQGADEPPAAAQPAANNANASSCCNKRCCSRRGKFRLRARRRCCVAQVATPQKPDPYAWKDLFDGKTLTGWKSPEFGGEGEVHVKDGAIVLEMGVSMTGLTWTGEVPRNNYEISLEGKRLDGVDFFCTTTFPVGEDHCSLVVGGWGGTVVGLSSVDFYDASDNFTTSFHAFEKERWYKVRIRVTDAKIEAWIDDEQVVAQERKGHKFGIRFEVDLCKPLGISAWVTKAAVRNMRLRNLGPDELQPQSADEE